MTFEEIEELSDEQIQEKEEEEAKSLLDIAAEATRKALDIIKSSLGRVSLDNLETTLMLHQDSIEELASSIPAPLLSGEPRVITTANTATIAWRTDKESSSLVSIVPGVEYDSTSDSPYTQTMGNPDVLETEHIVSIYNLEPDTLYHYQLRSKAKVGPEARSTDFTFRTRKEILEIANYTIENISDEVAIFKWVTNIEADSAIKYTPYRNNILAVDEAKVIYEDTYTTIHEVEGDNFEAGVIYEVELISKDLSENTVSEKISSFSTAKDDLPPVIYQVQTKSAISPGKNVKIQSIISWLTNENSTSKMYYQKGIARATDELDEMTAMDEDYTKTHVVVVTKFDPGTVYSFRVESIDSGGNTALSKVYTILTPRQQESVFQVIMKNIEEIFGWVGGVR
ncbi:MAG: hypothetical protein GY853_06925 [PVC group bacterium]|nr:hypothetical protein [PVC group bacterium]